MNGAAPIFAVAAPFQFALVILADAMEIERHSLSVTTTVHLLALIAIVLAVAAVYTLATTFLRALRSPTSDP